MENELISKKELLELTGVSYGQLYRWKRKNLIPEDWFIKKSTFTGQETFFEKEKVLERIGKIKNMKDDLSLDSIAEMFSPQLAEIFLNKKELIEKEIVTQMTLDIFQSSHGATEVYSFEKILNLAVLEKFLKTGEIGLEEGKIILKNLEDNYRNFKDRNCEVIFIRKFGIGISLLVSIPTEIFLDSSSKMVGRVNVSVVIEELKLKAVTV